MKTILCAGALGALCMNAVAADGASVSVYGLVDVALVRETGGSGGDVTKLTSGVGAGSRLGFKGREELGNGIAAIFLLESGFQADTGALGQGGLLAGYFYFDDAAKGPPFGITRAELDALLSPAFECIADEAVEDSIPVFAGKERWMVWRRR